ncbi:MAG: TolC family protein [Balneola sp.]|nr:MAG: TolC family protein [Balneola sp.]
MKRILSLALLITTITTATTLGQSVQKITLQDAIQISLENNYLLKQAENNLALADESIRSEYADFLPSLNSSASYSRQTGRQFVQETLTFDDVTSQSINGSVSTNLTIFNGFENIISLRQSQIAQTSAEDRLQREKETVIFNTATRFLQVLLDTQLLENAQENLSYSERQLEQIQAQVEVGSRPQVDLFNQEATVANNELTVTQNENTLVLSRLNLIRQLQIDPLGDYEFVVPEIGDEQASSANPSAYSLEELIDEALATRADYRTAEANIKNFELQLQLSKTRLIPTVGANASISSGYSDQYSLFGESVSFNDQFFDQRINRTYGLSLSIPIFQNWDRMYNIESSKVNLKNAELGLDDTRLGIIQEVTQAFTTYSAYVKAYEASTKARVASEKAFETEQERYNVGASTLVELTQAQANFVQAQSNYTRDLYNLVFQEKLLDFYLGKLSGETVEF